MFSVPVIANYMRRKDWRGRKEGRKNFLILRKGHWVRRHMLFFDIGPVWNGGLKLLQGLWLSLVCKEIHLEGKTYALIMA